MNYIGRAITLGLVSFFMIGQLEAQKKKITQEEQLAHAKLLYESYRFAEVKDVLSRLMSSRRGMSSVLEGEMERLERRAERAERMLENVEAVHLSDSVHIARKDFSDFILRLPEPFRRSISISDSGAVVSGVQALENIGKKFSSLDIGGNREIVCSDLITSSEVVEDAVPLRTPINSPEDEISPFVLPDGERLIFSRASDDGLGGYDFYWSRYNADKDMYYEPVLLGMPFNSPYNDYLFVYDDQTDESILVSDRFCSPDSLVIYRFWGLPKALKTSGLEDENLTQDESPQEVESLRRKALFQVDRVSIKREDLYVQDEIYLPLRDGVVLRSWNDFLNDQARNLYREYLAGNHRLQVKKDELRTVTKAYLGAKTKVEEHPGAVTELRSEIEALEQKQSGLIKEVKNLEISQRF